MDCIKIRQLEIFAYHGCNEDEKINGQKFYVDANLYTDVRTPGLSDDLEDTVNYAKACKFINKFMTENRFDLIEAVAEQTTRGLLKEFPKIKAIDFTINKPNAPIKLPFGNVAVSISRKWNKAYLSIGSNIGDKEGYLNQAIDSLYDDENCRVRQRGEDCGAKTLRGSVLFANVYRFFCLYFKGAPPFCQYRKRQSFRRFFAVSSKAR